MKIRHVLLPASIRARLTLLIILVSVVSISVVGLLSLYRTKLILTHEAKEKLLLNAQLQGALFEQEIKRVKATQQTIESIIRSNISHYPRIDSVVIQKIKTEAITHMLQWGKLASPLSMWVVFNPHWAKGANTISFIYNPNTDSYDREQEYDISKMNLGSIQYAWWTKAIEYGEIWTEPYYWKNWDKTLISYSKAVYYNNTLIACIGSDFDFTLLKANWMNVKLYKTGYLMLLDQSFNFIIHPNKLGANARDIIGTTDYNTLINSINNKQEGVLNYTFNKQDKILAYYKLSNNWVLLASAPLSEILLPLDKIIKTMLLLMLLAVVLAVLLSYYFSEKLYAPILRLIQLFEKSSKGDLNNRWEASNFAEFDKLGFQYNVFIDQMQYMLQQLNMQQKELSYALRRSQVSDELKSAFLGNISHEIRTPLYAITGLASLLEKEEISKDDKHNYIQIIYKNNDKLLQFVDNVMIFSKLERNQLTPTYAKVNVIDLINELTNINNKQYTADNKQIVYNINKSDEHIELYTDRSLLKIIIGLLIDNAWKFTPQGNILVGFQMRENRYMFYVEDTGVGIPLMYHKQIFNKFYKYNNYNNDILYEGVGMGLSIVKGLTLLLEGEIKIESTPSVGSRFEVWMPFIHTNTK